MISFKTGRNYYDATHADHATVEVSWIKQPQDGAISKNKHCDSSTIFANKMQWGELITRSEVENLKQPLKKLSIKTSLKLFAHSKTL